MKRNFFLLITMTLSMLFLFNGCDTNNNNTNPSDDPSATGLHVDLTGVKALAGGEVSTKSTAEDAFQLVKIMSDGSIQPALEDLNIEMSSGISFIAKSPVTDDIYIAGVSNFYINWQDYGQLLHIDENGDIFAVIPPESTDDWYTPTIIDWSWNGSDDFKPVEFDNEGNLYFLAQEYSGNENIQQLYRYEPGSGETAKTLTAPLEGYSYDQFIVDPTGTYLFLKGSRWSDTTSANFMRMYTIGDMTNFKNVYYSSSGNVWVQGIEISPDGRSVIMNGWNIRGINGILRADIVDSQTLEYTKLYDSDTSDWFSPYFNSWEDYNGDTYYNGLFTASWESGYRYYWADYWHIDGDPAKALDTARIMEYVNSYFVSDVVFTYDGKFGDEAFAAFLAYEETSGGYITEEIYSSPSDEYYFLKAYFVDARDNSSDVLTFYEFRENNDLGWLDFTNIGNLFFDSDGNLWGVLADWYSSTSYPKPIKLLDSNGDRDLALVNAFNGDTYMPVGFTIAGDHFYFRDAVRDGDGYETGWHKMYRFPISEGNVVVEDCLKNVPGNGTLEIIDFSIDDADTVLYFTALYGVEIIGGKVDLNSNFTYTPFDTDYRLSSIEVF